MLSQASELPDCSSVPRSPLPGEVAGGASRRLADMSIRNGATRTARRVAVAYADVVGFSRMMCDDEEGTIARWLAVRRNVLKPLVKVNNGWMVNAIGDSFLAEFCEVADAVAWARQVQRSLCDLGAAGTGGGPAFKLRIAVHFCEVIAMHTDIFGVGVNIVARLQTYAPPGGVIISGAAYHHLGGTEVEVKALGPLPLRNIAEPVHAYLL